MFMFSKREAVVTFPLTGALSPQAHVSVSMQPSEVGPVAVLEFWVQALISQHLWYREEPILVLMDHLCKTAFQLMQEDCVQKLLYQQHKVSLLDKLSCSQWLDSSLLKSSPKSTVLSTSLRSPSTL